MSGYLRDISLRKQLEEKVKEAAKTRQSAEVELTLARQIVEGAKGIDADTSRAELALAEATAAMGNKDYKKALEKAVEAKERGRQGHKERVAAVLTSGHSQLELARRLGSDVSEAQALLRRAEEAQASEDYGGAIDAARRAWKRTEKILHEHQSAQFSKAQALVHAAKALGRDVGAADDLLSRARSSVESGDYESALNFTQECIDAVTGDLGGEFEPAFAASAALARTVRETGGDSTKAESLLERARGDAERLEFEKAFNALKQSRAESERVLDRNMDTFLATFSRQAETADRLGADTAPARAEFRKAEEAIRAHRLQEAATVGQRALHLLAQAQVERIAGRIAESREKIVSARQMGVNIEPVLNLLRSARKASQEGAFEQGLEYADRAGQELNHIIGEHRSIEERATAMYGALADAESLGVSTTGARGLLERVRLLLQEAQSDAAGETLNEAQAELDRAAYERTMEVVRQGEFGLTLGERLGAQTSGARRNLNDAISAAKNRDYKVSIDLAGKARSELELTVGQHLAIERASLKASHQFVGDDAAKFRTLIAKSESAQAAKDLEGAFSFLEEARELAHTKKRERATAFHETLRVTVELGLDLGAAVADLEAMLKEATALIGQGRHSEVIGLQPRVAPEMARLAEPTFNLLKQRILDARTLNIDIEPMRDLLKRSKTLLDAGDNGEGYRVMKECNDLVNASTAAYRDANVAMQSAAAVIAEAKKRGADVSKVAETLVEGKKALDRMEFNRARDLGNRAKAETEKLMALYASAQRIISSRERFELAAQLGLDVPQLRDRLNEAKEAMKSKDYDRAFRLSDTLSQELGQEIRTKVGAILDAAETLASGTKTGVGPQQETLRRARELLERGELAQAADLAVRTRVELERIGKKLEDATAKIARAREAIGEIEAIGLPIENSTLALEAAESSLEAGRVDEADELGAKVLTVIAHESETNAAQAMRRLEESISLARQDGIDTRSAEKMFERAKEFLVARQYRQALALAMQSESEAERIGLQHSMATTAIGNVDKRLAALGTPLPLVRSMIDDARRALQERDLVRALDIAFRAADAFSVGRELITESLDQRARAEKLLAVASRIRADATKVEAAMREGTAALEAGNAEGARVSFTDAVQLGLAVCKERFMALLERGRRYADLARRLEMDASSVWEKFADAKAQIESDNFEAAMPVIEEAQRGAEKAVGEKVVERLNEAEAAVLHAQKIGADTGKGEDLLRRARGAVAESAFDQALSLILESQDQVESRRLVEKRFVSLTYKADATIRRARKFGIDMHGAEQALRTAEQTWKTDTARAIGQAEESYRLAWQAVEAFAPSFEAHLLVSEPRVNEWSDATLALTNVGRALAKDVRIQILGDADVEGLREIAAVRAKGTEVLTLRVRPGSTGTIPLAIQVASKRVFDDKEYAQEIVAQVDIGTPSPGGGQRPVRAVAESTCPVCRGTVKAGQPTVRCGCARLFHAPCATRASTCPMCLRPLGPSGTS